MAIVERQNAAPNGCVVTGGDPSGLYYKLFPWGVVIGCSVEVQGQRENRLKLTSLRDFVLSSLYWESRQRIP